MLEASQGHRFTATFSEALKRSVQYGNNIKAHSVYMSQFQLVPVDRVRDHFADPMGVPVNSGLSATLTCNPTMGWRDSKTGQNSNSSLPPSCTLTRQALTLVPSVTGYTMSPIRLSHCSILMKNVAGKLRIHSVSSLHVRASYAMITGTLLSV